jgi:glycogen phosphorylase
LSIQAATGGTAQKPQREVKGSSGFTVPVYLLDYGLPVNTERDRKLTHCLYGGDASYRLCQETMLGISGVRMLPQHGRCRGK